MNKLLIVILLVFVFQSCKEEYDPEVHFINKDINNEEVISNYNIFYFKSHSYIKFFPGSSGRCVVHDPDCPCK